MRADFETDDEFHAAIKEYTDALTETERYQDWYANTIEPTLAISREVGNWYTGSVHIARAAGLKHARESGLDLDEARLLVASYGSGAQAEVHAETIVPGGRRKSARSTSTSRYGTATTSPSPSTNRSTTSIITRPRPMSRSSPRPKTSSPSTAGAGWVSGNIGTWSSERHDRREWLSSRNGDRREPWRIARAERSEGSRTDERRSRENSEVRSEQHEREPRNANGERSDP